MRALLLVSSLLPVSCAMQDKAQAERIKALEAQVKDLELKVGVLELSVMLMKDSTEPYKSATFDPSEPGPYQRIDTAGGQFLVSLQNVAPHVDGYRVSFDFGNPSSATFKGFTLKAKWGRRYNAADKTANWATWHESLLEKELSLTDELRAGAWNRVSFVVAPAKADEFGHLELSMETNTVSLHK